jgi:hypothetical protein
MSMDPMTRKEFVKAWKRVFGEPKIVEETTKDPDHKETNPKDNAATTRLDLSLAPESAIAYMALAFVEGDLKYGGFNWRAAGVQTSVYVAACRRHIAKYFNGEWADPRTKVPHLANALACLAVLVDAHEQGNMDDDRPPIQSVDLYTRFEENVAHLQKIFPRKRNRYRATDRPSYNDGMKDEADDR